MSQTHDTITCDLCSQSAALHALGVPGITPIQEGGSDWRFIQVNEEKFHYCPKHFPPDGEAHDAFRDAYERVVRHSMNLFMVRFRAKCAAKNGAASQARMF
jgi:hypothetical protein